MSTSLSCWYFSSGRGSNEGLLSATGTVFFFVAVEAETHIKCFNFKSKIQTESSVSSAHHFLRQQGTNTKKKEKGKCRERERERERERDRPTDRQTVRKTETGRCRENPRKHKLKKTTLYFSMYQLQSPSLHSPSLPLLFQPPPPQLLLLP